MTNTNIMDDVQVAKEEKQSKKQYCLFLGNGQYLVRDNQNGFMAVFGMSDAESFNNKDMAEQANRELCAEASIVDFYTKPRKSHNDEEFD
jgi:hypothetical protein